MQLIVSMFSEGSILKEVLGRFGKLVNGLSR
jgi:hypothetical protein